MELDLDGYIRLGALRKDFDQWLRDERLTEHCITWMRFGDGYVEADPAGCRARAHGQEGVILPADAVDRQGGIARSTSRAASG